MHPARSSVRLVLGLLALGGVALADGAPPAPRVALPVLPADGHQETPFEVPAFGRYALRVHSLQGAGLQLVDRMTGPGPADGQPGGRDGRLDVFLDRGTYKLLIDALPGGRGDLRVEALPFTEQHAAPQPLLPPLHALDSTLEDLQQRSWWVDVGRDGQVLVDVAGRALADVRLWRDGSWLEAATPDCREITPREGRPLTRCTLATKVDPGFYLLTAYGGPPRAWAEDDGASPLHVRSGLPELAAAGRLAARVSPFGEDLYRVPGGPDHFRLELPEPEPATLLLRGADGRGPRSAELLDDSRVPVAELTDAGRGPRVVVVRARAGQPYVLQHLTAISGRATLDPSTPVRVDTLHTGAPGDALDATSILVARDSDSRARVVGADVVSLDDERGWARRFNLTSPATLFIEIQEAGTYRLRSTGTPLRHRLEPFLTSTPEDYRAPPWTESAEGSHDLSPGLYVLHLDPVTPGVAQVQVGWDGWMSSALRLVGVEDTFEATPPRVTTRHPRVEPRPGPGDYALYVNRRPESTDGLLVTPLPLTLEHALPLALNPGPGEALDVKVDERSVLVAVDEAGRLLPVSVDGAAPGPSQPVKPGARRVQVINPGEAPVMASLMLKPWSRRPEAELPPPDPVDLATLPDFPALRAGRPVGLDLPASGASTWQVEVDEPGLYVLESTGLLATAGSLRTRVQPRATLATENGAGRNFRLATYLREGDYQLTVSTRGRSAGHLGLRLQPSPLVEGGELGEDVPARAQLAAGEGVRYTFEIPEAGLWRLHAQGQQGPARCRLEDAEGWPLVAPGGPAEIELHLRPGRYSLILLPEDVEARRITTLSRVAGEAPRSGPGPHALTPGEAARGTWLEPPRGQERPPVVYTFTLPAPADLAITTTGEMAGELLDARGERVGRLAPDATWTGRLPTGDYRVELLNARRNHGVEYTLLVDSAQLLEGQRRPVFAPSTVPVSVGRAGLVELSSLGRDDVRAELLDANGRVIAASDDRPQDWNFRVVARLEPGEYTLRVLPVGTETARPVVVMRAPAEQLQPAMRLPMVLALQPGEDVQLIPLETGPEDALLAVRARSAEGVGVAVEALVDGRWLTASQATDTASTQVVRLGGAAEAWRLRVWSLDLRGNPVELRVDRLRPDAARETALARGLTLTGASRSVPGVGAARVKLNRPGVFLTQPVEGLRWCPGPARACPPLTDPAFATSEETLWLVGVFDERLRVEAARASLDAPVEGLRLWGEAPVVVDIEGRGGPVLAVARAAEGQPGARIVQGLAARNPEAGGAGVAPGEGAALAVALSGTDPALVLWPAAGLPAGGMVVGLRQAAFDAPEPEDLAPGRHELTLQPGEARTFRLPGSVDLRLVLDDGLVAVQHDDDQPGPTLWADGRPLDTDLRGARGQLTLLHAGLAEGPRGLRLTVSPGAAGVAPLAYGQPFERHLLRPGHLRLELAPGQPGDMLSLRGDLRAARLLTPDGQVYEGSELPAHLGGALHVEHGPGLLLAWVSRDELDGQGLWRSGSAAGGPTLTLPARLDAEGPEAQVQLDVDAAGLLSLRAPGALVVGLTGPDGLERTWALPDSGVLDAWVTPGLHRLRVRGLGGQTLPGDIELLHQAPTPIGEGLGPEVLLGAGDSRPFSFEAPGGLDVGFGARASAERVVVTLLDARGEPLAAGSPGMVRLGAGPHVLVLHLPPEAEPVRVQPALAGVDPPDTGPPDDVVRAYTSAPGGVE